MHHKIFDHRTFTLISYLKIQVTQIANSSVSLKEWILRDRDKCDPTLHALKPTMAGTSYGNRNCQLVIFPKRFQRTFKEIFRCIARC